MNTSKDNADGRKKTDDKAARLGQALRDNLKKRKAQAKARQEEDPETGPDNKQESSDG